MLALLLAVLAVGVKVAVRVSPVPLMALNVPPETLMSPVEPSHAKVLPGSSENEKVMLAVWPINTFDLLLEMLTVGAVVSTLCADWVATAAWVMVALLPGTSVMVPEFNASAFKAIANPSVSVSSATTGYVNTSVFVPEPDE